MDMIINRRGKQTKRKRTDRYLYRRAEEEIGEKYRSGAIIPHIHYLRLLKKRGEVRKSLVPLQTTLQPPMPPHLLDIRTHMGLLLEAPCHQRERRTADPARAAALADNDASLDGVVLGREGRVACEEVREEDAERPYLCRRGLVRLLAQDLGGRVGGRAEEEGVEGCWGVGIGNDGAAEVDEFDLDE